MWNISMHRENTTSPTGSSIFAPIYYITTTLKEYNFPRPSGPPCLPGLPRQRLPAVPLRLRLPRRHLRPGPRRRRRPRGPRGPRPSRPPRFRQPPRPQPLQCRVAPQHGRQVRTGKQATQSVWAINSTALAGQTFTVAEWPVLHIFYFIKLAPYVVILAPIWSFCAAGITENCIEWAFFLQRTSLWLNKTLFPTIVVQLTEANLLPSGLLQDCVQYCMVKHRSVRSYCVQLVVCNREVHWMSLIIIQVDAPPPFEIGWHFRTVDWCIPLSPQDDPRARVRAGSDPPQHAGRHARHQGGGHRPAQGLRRLHRGPRSRGPGTDWGKLGLSNQGEKGRKKRFNFFEPFFPSFPDSEAIRSIGMGLTKEKKVENRVVEIIEGPFFFLSSLDSKAISSFVQLK